MLFIGLGNIGSEYERTRHNIGFMLIDALVDKYGIEDSEKDKFHSTYYTANIEGRKVYFQKPSTFMNRSGIAGAELANFFKIPLDQTFAIHDDLDLELNKVKIKQGGGHGGHNGLKSLDAHVGNNYHRLRLGISHPGNKSKVNKHVLGRFTEDELADVNLLLEKICDNFELLISEGKEAFLTKLAL